jgi:hypothetical protein
MQVARITLVTSVGVTEAGNALGVNKNFRQVLKAPGPRLDENFSKLDE